MKKTNKKSFKVTAILILVVMVFQYTLFSVQPVSAAELEPETVATEQMTEQTQDEKPEKAEEKADAGSEAKEEKQESKEETQAPAEKAESAAPAENKETAEAEETSEEIAEAPAAEASAEDTESIQEPDAEVQAEEETAGAEEAMTGRAKAQAFTETPTETEETEEETEEEKEEIKVTVEYSLNTPANASFVPDIKGIDGNSEKLTAKAMKAYEIRGLSRNLYQTQKDKVSHKISYEFTGWKTENGKIVSSADVVDLEAETAKFDKNRDGKVKLTATWSNTFGFKTDGKYRYTTFSIYKTGHVPTAADNNASNYVGGIYGTIAYPGDATEPLMKNWKQDGTGRVVINQDSNGIGLDECDEMIRDMVNTPISNYYDSRNGNEAAGYNEYEISILDFPSDEEVLAVVRGRIEDGLKIIVEFEDGARNLTVDDLDTFDTDHYTVKWFSVKYQNNGIHIDGIIVPAVKTVEEPVEEPAEQVIEETNNDTEEPAQEAETDDTENTTEAENTASTESTDDKAKAPEAAPATTESTEPEVTETINNETEETTETEETSEETAMTKEVAEMEEAAVSEETAEAGTTETEETEVSPVIEMMNIAFASIDDTIAEATVRVEEMIMGKVNVPAAAPATGRTETEDTLTANAVQAAETENTATEDVITETLEDFSAPLANTSNESGSWALVNLILAILAAAAGILAAAKARGRNITIKLMVLFPAVVAIIAFLITENMRLSMVMIDEWTIHMAIIFVIQMLSTVITRKAREEEEEAVA